MDRKLEGSYVYLEEYNGQTWHHAYDYGIVKKLDADFIAQDIIPSYLLYDSEEQLYIVEWINSKQYSAAFSEKLFYNTGNADCETRWPVMLDGSASDKEKFAFRLKYGI